MSINKDRYGPGDNILTTMFSTKNCWVYLFHEEAGSARRLNKVPISLEAQRPSEIDKVTANEHPGEDNLVGIALIENRPELLSRAVDKLFSNSKSHYSEREPLWKSCWITFAVR